MSNIKSKIGIGDSVVALDKSYGQATKITGYVTGINGDDVVIKSEQKEYRLKISDVERNPDTIGVNPFPKKTWNSDMTNLNRTLGFVYSNRGVVSETNDGLKIHGFNFNPYIVDKGGNKVYYQRDFCWSLEQKQSFLNSIYNNLNCGAIVLRYNSLEKMRETQAEYDIVDGKQRLSTLIDFFCDKITDRYGNKFSDFSRVAQRTMMMRNCMQFFEFGENVTDLTIKRAFLNVNYTGEAMSKEHLEFVKNIIL